MAEYKVEVTTGDRLGAGTFDYIYLTLIGSEGVSERTVLDNFGIDFIAGATGTYTVKSAASLGKLLLVKVEKDPYFSSDDDEWLCSKIRVTTPEKEVILFPCNRWVSRGENVELRGGKAMKVYEEEHPVLIEHRKKEVAFNKKLYRWGVYAAGMPHINSIQDPTELPEELHFTTSRNMEVFYTVTSAKAELKFKGLDGSTEQWENIEAIKDVFTLIKSPLSEYVADHWMEDEFYASQFLNGSNPNLIQRCSKLPSNFPVTEEMVKPFLKDGTSLQKEMEKGNIFICDYKRMDGIPTREYNGGHLHLTPGLCLFYVNPENKLMPIAIQLYQQPSEQNPIFLPSDPKDDWLLAKMYLRNADAVDISTVSHLLSTHFLSETFAIATIRNFPVIHPLYKLLLPHFRYNIRINIMARDKLLGPEGGLSQSSLGDKGLTEVMRRAQSEMTYSSLCLPDNIAARGLESVPNFFYRDDGLKVWAIINSFVEEIVKYYYPTDNDVRKDSELQAWINDIFTHSFLAKKDSGIPTSFQTVEEVIKFITMVIFRVTGQHAAVNNGQYDYNSWTPNSPALMRKAPPTTKGKTTMKTILESLPTVGDSVKFMIMAWMLSNQYTDTVPLGTYPAERFDEPAPNEMIKKFQAELAQLSEVIAKRNKTLAIPYYYLNPIQIENSITI